VLGNELKQNQMQKDFKKQKKHKFSACLMLRSTAWTSSGWGASSWSPIE
jgi:hypothetical protein